ncbi:histidine phosphatase family protein [Propionimicrobium sp. BV2F7]|uniref:histidine phosphatase family protein n=1 Tax=Propionimicrobium TaxID=203133 RepID=UPI0003D79A7A|nr:histidine phosphatase family protein [Propionimicrobium sp. BV2F7]ETJ97038.1 histidine phosphatase superfamily (branch 1) [Propionimicrobium sp. BV2F7]
MTLTKVHLIRHGEVHNPEGILYGRLPGFYLSSNGRQMADALAEHFSDYELGAFISSPLERARETIAPIVSSHDGELEIDERLIEAGNKLAGQVFGKNNKAIFDPRNLRYYYNPFKPSWGEPYAEIAERMQAAVRDAAKKVGPGGQAVMVSHQLPIWVCRLAFEGKKLYHDPRKRTCRVGSVTTFAFRDDELLGIGYLEPAKHLLGADANRAFSSGK